MRKQVANSKRFVVKVGSALVTNDGTGLSNAFIQDCARQISALISSGKQVILVSSGAIAEGMQRLGWTTRPKSMHELQAAAAVGQMGLTQAYENAFASHGLKSAQILLTHDDLADRKRYLNARTTLHTLIDLGVVPIINENDTVVTDEIRFGDNDTLGALVANLVEADCLLIMTDQAGLYSEDPRINPAATLISEGNAENKDYLAIAGGAGSRISKGGMITKILAAQRAARSGTHTLIVGGRAPDALMRSASGENIGTLLTANKTPLAARKQWLADHLRVTGSVVIDDGAVNALHNGKSLLPIGIKAVKGDFDRGSVIACLDENMQEIARGLANYNYTEANKILGKASNEIEDLLGYVDTPELIHRDNLVLMSLK